MRKMAKRKGTPVYLAICEYIDRDSDLKNNPKYEDMSNEEIQPLFDENEEMLKAALLKDEDETCSLLRSCLAFSLLEPYFSLIQQHFKSKKIALRLDDTLARIKRGEGSDDQRKPDNFPEAQKLVDEANKFAE